MIFFDANVIYAAMNKTIKSSDKSKYSTQLYQVNKLLYTAMLQEALRKGKYKPSKGKKFVLRERGKTRYITSNVMADKVVNHMICDEVLTPALQRFLIHDNSASQKGKGVSFHRKRFEQHLREYFRKNGTNEGYILLGDFSGYYANIRHDVCSEVLARFLKRSTIGREDLQMAWRIMGEIFQTFRVDVSRFSDDEIRSMYAGKADAMLNYGVDKRLLTGKKYLCKGVDIGNQISQNIGVAFPYKIDNYAKIVCGNRYYKRYSDDFAAIGRTREELLDMLEGFRGIAREFGIIINERKTRIVKLSSFFRHLQDGYNLTPTGKVIRKINPKSITRERRKLKAYKRLLEAGRITQDKVENIYKGWICNNWRRMSHRQIYNIHQLYISLFGREITWKKKRGKTYSRLRWLMSHSSKDWE
ncbi:MAG: hypothetical protein IJM68_00655 [Synergistaceae bacterium]|nr:hypothetical protein [Synergistaceae bacterium]